MTTIRNLIRRYPAVCGWLVVLSVVALVQIVKWREPMFNRAPGLPKGIPPKFAALLSAPIPAVDPEDMRRIWPLFESVWKEKPGNGATGIDVSVLAERCSPGANIEAISARVALVKALSSQGLLDKWKEGDNLRPKVFEVTAKCPLTPEASGMKFDPEAILAALGQ